MSLRELLQAAGVVSQQRRHPSASASSSASSGPASASSGAPASSQQSADAVAAAAKAEPRPGTWGALCSRSVAAVQGMVAAKAPYDPEFWPTGKIAIKVRSLIQPALLLHTRMMRGCLVRLKCH